MMSAGESENNNENGESSSALLTSLTTGSDTLLTVPNSTKRRLRRSREEQLQLQQGTYEESYSNAFTSKKRCIFHQPTQKRSIRQQLLTLISSHIALMLIFFGLILSPCCVVEGISKRGTEPWTIILCKFYDIDTEPESPEWFRQWLSNRQQLGSIQRFFESESNGIYRMDGSNVVGWLTLPYTKGDVQALAAQDPYLAKLSDDKLRLYYKTKEICLKFGEAQVGPAGIHPNVINIINDENTAVFCRESGVLLTPKFLLSSALAHEMTHSFNIGHSYSDRPVKIFPYSENGEYDDKYDLMSTANAFMNKERFGMNGPGLNGPHKDYLGWLPSNRVLYFGQNGRQEAIVRMGSLSVANKQSRGYHLVHIPYDRDNPANVFTVEFRTPDGNDKGIKRPAIVIHKIVSRDGGYLFSYLVTHGKRYYELIVGTEWRHFLEHSPTHGQMYIRVRFLRTNRKTFSADVHIISTFNPNACLKGEGFRSISDSDRVCVKKPKVGNLRIAAESPLTVSTRDGQCLNGFVERKAVRGDKECVPEAEKSEIQQQNIRFFRRLNFFSFKTYGLNACKTNFVWRQIDAYDYSCVSQDARSRVLFQNNLDESRRDPKTGRCRGGFVERHAFETDRTCVTHGEREESRLDALRQPDRLRYFAFFNGVDDVHTSGHTGTPSSAAAAARGDRTNELN